MLKFQVWFLSKMPLWFHEWCLKNIHGVKFFHGAAIEYSERCETELILHDCFIVWKLWGNEGVELGYDDEGLLNAIKIPDCVLHRLKDKP